MSLTPYDKIQFSVFYWIIFMDIPLIFLVHPIVNSCREWRRRKMKKKWNIMIEKYKTFKNKMKKLVKKIIIPKKETSDRRSSIKRY